MRRTRTPCLHIQLGKLSSNHCCICTMYYIWRGRVIFFTISDPRWDQPINDISIFFASWRLILMHRTHFMQNIRRKWPKSSIFKIQAAVATRRHFYDHQIFWVPDYEEDKSNIVQLLCVDLSVFGKLYCVCCSSVKASIFSAQLSKGDRPGTIVAATELVLQQF